VDFRIRFGTPPK